MPFLTAFLASIAVFLICNSVIELIKNKKTEKLALYDEITNVFEEDRGIKSIEQRNFIEKIRIMLQSSNMPLDFQEFLYICGGMYIFVSFIVGSILGLFLGLIAGFAPLVGFYLYMQSIIKNRNKKVVQQLPDFALMFASGYEAGYSIENCFDYCARELKFPINQEMVDIFGDITVRKLTLVAALNNWYERNPNEDILFVIKGLLLCQEKSGDVSTIMRSLQEKLRDRAHIVRFIEKKTQNLRYTAKFIQAVPIGALAISFLSNHDKFVGFATNIVGIIMLGFCLVCYIVGTFLINHFINGVYKD
jgi:Flp pilus assembly protein TadB